MPSSSRPMRTWSRRSSGWPRGGSGRSGRAAVSFIWPPLLLLLLAVPVGVLLYRARERRRAERVARFGWGGALASAAEGGGAGERTSAVGRRTRWTRQIQAGCTVPGVT